MRWFKRGVWLFVWAAWAWLGVGLYRELPRELGPVVCQLPWERGMGQLGFVGDSDEFAMLHSAPGDPDFGVVLYDVATGSAVRKIPLPSGAEPRFDGFGLRRHGAFVIDMPEGPDGGAGPGAYLLDLRRGRWKFLTGRTVREAALHPERPWAMVVEGLRPERPAQRVRVVDFAADRELFARETPIKEHSHAFFVPGVDRLVVPAARAEPGRRADEVVGHEIWQLGAAPTLVKSIEGARLGPVSGVGRNGVAVFRDWTTPTSFEVFDLERERVAFAVRDETLAAAGSSMLFEPALSASGKTVLGGRPMTLWDVQTGAALWRQAGYENPWPVNSAEQFMVIETWHKLWERWLSALHYETRAFRRFEDGRLVVRTAAKDLPWPDHVNAAGTLAVGTDATVHRWPLLVNWPLLVVCQSFLTLPLVLLWAGLKWRARRCLREAAQ